MRCHNNFLTNEIVFICTFWIQFVLVLCPDLFFLNSCVVRAHWYLAVICFPGLEGALYEQNPLYHGPFPAPPPAADPPSEEEIPDHCRPLSPERDGLENSSAHSSPSVPEGSAEGQTEGEHKENSAIADRGPEASSTPVASGNGQADPEQQYTSESSDS